MNNYCRLFCFEFKKYRQVFLFLFIPIMIYLLYCANQFGHAGNSFNTTEQYVDVQNEDKEYGYSQYIANVLEETDNMISGGLFSNTSLYIKRKGIIAKGYYQRLEAQNVRLTNIGELEFFISSMIPDFFALSAIFVITHLLLFYEFDTNMISVLLTKKLGKDTLCSVKLTILALFSMILVLCIWGIPFFWCMFMNQGAASLPVQSLEAFKGCPFFITIGEMVSLFLAGKSACYILIAFIIFSITLMIRNVMFDFFLVVALGTIAFEIDHLFPLQYENQIWANLSLSRMLDIGKRLASLEFVRILDYPLEYYKIAMFVWGFLLCASLSIIKRFSCIENHISYSLKGILKKNMSLRPVHIRLKSLISAEFSKAWITIKTYWLLILLIVIQVLMMKGNYALSEEETFYRMYCNQYHLYDWEELPIEFDRVTAEFDDLEEQENLIYEAYSNNEISDARLEIELRSIENERRKQEAFWKVQLQYDAIEGREASGSRIIYQTPWKVIFGGLDTLNYILRIFLFTICSMLFLYAYRKMDLNSGVENLLKVTVSGKEYVMKYKRRVAFLTVIVFYLISFGPVWYFAQQTFGISSVDLMADLSSLTILPLSGMMNMPILAFLLILILGKILLLNGVIYYLYR